MNVHDFMALLSQGSEGMPFVAASAAVSPKFSKTRVAEALIIAMVSGVSATAISMYVQQPLVMAKLESISIENRELKHMVTQQSAQLAELNVRHEVQKADHEVRLRVLENRRP